MPLKQEIDDLIASLERLKAINIQLEEINSLRNPEAVGVDSTLWRTRYEALAETHRGLIAAYNKEASRIGELELTLRKIQMYLTALHTRDATAFLIMNAIDAVLPSID